MQSELGKGSQFSVRLPVHEAGEAVARETLAPGKDVLPPAWAAAFVIRFVSRSASNDRWTSRFASWW